MPGESSFPMTRDDLDHMRLFQKNRLAWLRSSESPVRQEDDQAILALHVFPFQSIVDRKFFDVVQKKEIFRSTDEFLSYRPNVDGYFGHNAELGRYQQLFRTGIIERVETLGLFNGEKKIPVGVLESEIARTLASFVPVFQTLTIVPPVYVFLSLIHIGGWKLIGCDANNQADRYEMRLPEMAFTAWPDDWGKALEPLFEILWNAFGLERPTA